MSWHLTVGPPASGRTTLMLEASREALQAGKRVWWVGLPAQRSFVLRRLTDVAPVALGFEFMSGQQLYYRLLTAAGSLRTTFAGTGMLVRVGEALTEVSGALPMPGEAQLFARAIAEAKRFGLGPADYARKARDAEQRRLAKVYAAYEELKDGWDYDDVRQQTVALVEGLAAGGAAAARGPVEADLVVVDGFRELGPYDVRVYRALAELTDVRVAVGKAPPGLVADLTLEGSARTERAAYLAPNPVTEARWVMASLKHDLFARGYEPLELAVIAPAEQLRVLLALADEYGVPLMDESPAVLAESQLGRRLLDLLELPEHPTAARLLAVPGLGPLAAAALAQGVAGADAVAELARELGLEEALAAAVAALEVDGDPVEWARSLLAGVLAGGAPLPREFEEGAIAMAQEAARLRADGPGFRAWWAALVRSGRSSRREPAGVALLTATRASGRRFRKAYVMGAVEGAFGAGEREDYFLPEEQRVDESTAAPHRALPYRFRGAGADVTAELLTRADELVITAARASQGGPLVPDALLVGASPPDLPRLPAASPSELGTSEAYRAPLGTTGLSRPTAERLRRYRECPFRLWGETVLGYGSRPEEETPEWVLLLRRLLAERNGRLTRADLGEIGGEFPAAREWLEVHAEELTALTYDVELFGGPRDAAANLHAARRVVTGDGQKMTVLYRFVAPGTVGSVGDAREYLRGRWAELYAADRLLARTTGDVDRVGITVWPVLGEPVAAYPNGFVSGFADARRRREWVAQELPEYLRGAVEPRPGYQCHDCPVFDVCREGVR